MGVSLRFKNKKEKHGTGAQRKAAQKAARRGAGGCITSLASVLPVPQLLGKKHTEMSMAFPIGTSLCSAATRLHSPVPAHPGTALTRTQALKEVTVPKQPTLRVPSSVHPPQGSCEAITIHNAPCSHWANRAQKSLVCWNKSTEQAGGFPMVCLQSKMRIHTT